MQTCNGSAYKADSVALNERHADKENDSKGGPTD
jgi:hypothetical protein